MLNIYIPSLFFVFLYTFTYRLVLSFHLTFLLFKIPPKCIKRAAANATAQSLFFCLQRGKGRTEKCFILLQR